MYGALFGNQEDIERLFDFAACLLRGRRLELLPTAETIAPVGWLADSVEQARKTARYFAQAEDSLDAEMVAAAIWLGHQGYHHQEICQYLRKNHLIGDHFELICDVLKADDFDSALMVVCDAENKAVLRKRLQNGKREKQESIRIMIAGAVAEACFGIPEDLFVISQGRMTVEMAQVMGRLEAQIWKMI